MRNLLLSTVAFAALAGSALAADLPTTKEAPVYVPPVPAFTWTGFYLGADIGGDFGSTSLHNIFTGVTSNRSVDTSGVMGGGYVGYNWQGLFGASSLFGGGLVVGVEGDFQGTSNSNTITFADLAGDAFQLRTQQNWLASANGRIGIAYDRALFYAIGGGAWSQRQATLSVFSRANALLGSPSVSNTLSGWDIGGGIEYAFTPNWVGRVEYRYYNFGNQNINDNGIIATFTPIREQVTVNTVRVGLAYLFSAPAPVVAKY